MIGFLNLTKDTSINSVEFNVREQNLKTSFFWNLTGTFMMTYVYHNGDIETGLYRTIAGILIDETLENFTWSKTAATYPWCNGSGTKEDPYIIEYVYIDGNFTGSIYPVYSNILIRHSRSYFIIKNCSLHKNGINEGGAIYLYNTTNGALLGNSFTYNCYGIYLFESHNNTIRFNNLLSNHDQEVVGTGSAIFLDGYGNGKGSCNNTVENNIMVNHYVELHISYSLNNIINRNFIKNTLFGYYPNTGGVYLYSSNYTSITYNTFAGDYADYSNPYGDYIIGEENCIGNVISNNFGQNASSASGKMLTAQEPKTWFTLVDSNYNYIYGNKLLKTITNPTIPGYTIGIILIIELMSLIILFMILRKKHILKFLHY
jgi:parallel beta-helix repeat protein